jgi:hypothetical protein
MPRPFRTSALAAVTLLVAACQDYNFNPVGHCLVQPGSERFTLSDLSSADVLFVVDDSGSMGGEQDRLANAFNVFVQNLTAANAARSAAGLRAIDYHIAVTTTSVFWSFETPQTCRSDCPGAGGQRVCCDAGGPAMRPRRCSAVGSAAECPAGSGTTCSTTCNGLRGEPYCCAADGTIPAAALTELVPCAREGIMCGSLETHYAYAGSCAAGSGLGIAPAQNGWPYPRGSFVGVTSPVVNPRVLHFDKRLADRGANAQGFTQDQLVGFFRDNVRVGVCGSGQEQGLQAARLALQSALAGTQKDTYAYDPNRDPAVSGPATLSWDAATRVASADAVWGRNPASKLVLVFVGDEDDCGSPEDPSGGVVMLSEAAGADACVRDASTPGPLGGKQFPVTAFVDYFTSLGRPLGAAFIVSARSTASDDSCSGSSCFADICCDHVCTGSANVCAGGVCGGQAPGTRFVEAARQLQAKGVDTVVGSICDPDFGTLLEQIAEIVKPPQTLALPSEPAASDIALLRIIRPNGDTKKLCGRPLAPRQAVNYTLQQAQDTGADWWYTATADPGPPYAGVSGDATVAVPTRFVYINSQKGGCRADFGDTYSADYLGVVPAGGCASDAECTQKLGGSAGALQCFTPPGLSRGTCTCAE